MSTKLIRPGISAYRTATLSRPLHSIRRFQTTGFKMSATSEVQKIETVQQFQTMIKERKVVILDAFATWCGPCKAISPLLDHGITFAKFDVDELPDLAQELGIRAMPTFTFFQDGNKVEEVVGANPGGLKKVLDKLAPEAAKATPATTEDAPAKEADPAVTDEK